MSETRPLLTLGLLGSICPFPAHAATATFTAPIPQIEICYQHGCARRALIELDRNILDDLSRRFAAAAGPAGERSAIAVAIGELERFAGSRTGTDRDLGGTFAGAFQPGQMDCIDEATNTTRYLRLFAQRGWLRWHDPADPVTRLPIPHGWWPHTTAVIRERASGREFAVDSWFETNGQPAHVVELSVWRHGWKPSGGRP